MGDKSKIEWTDSTWNPVVGCTQISPGCDVCYALTLHNRRHQAWLSGAWPDAPEQYHLPFEQVQLLPDRLDIPLHWLKPRRVFVNSLSDLFHDDVPDSFIDQVFLVMAIADRHTFQVLTKRPKRMRQYLHVARDRLITLMRVKADEGPNNWAQFTKGEWRHISWIDRWAADDATWPLPNVWLGTSIELDRYAWRANYLRETPAAVRFISAEPLLGHLDSLDLAGIDWLIVGGESGGAEDRRLVERCTTIVGYEDGYYHTFKSRTPCGTACPGCNGTQLQPKAEAWIWVSKLRDAAAAAGTAFFFKQWGGARPTSGGRLLDGRTWDEMPGRVAVPA